MMDLHVHSHYSPDAESAPEALIDAALRAGVRLLSITDHDGVDHIEPALRAAEGKALRLVPGLELTCSCPAFGLNEIHILAHFRTADGRPWCHPSLTELLEEITSAQAQNLTSLMRGLNIPAEALARAHRSLIESGQSTIGTRPALHLFKRCPPELRPFHWAEMKIKRDRIRAELREGGLWHPLPPVNRVLRVLTLVGASATLAHPGRYDLNPSTLSDLIDSIIAEGLTGLEAVYLPQPGSAGLFGPMAKAKACVITAGSDSHSAQAMLHPAYVSFIASTTDLHALI